MFFPQEAGDLSDEDDDDGGWTGTQQVCHCSRSVWTDAQDQGTFEESVKLIVKAIRKGMWQVAAAACKVCEHHLADLSHCRMHTSLLLRALEFDNSDFDESLLLRDKECEVRTAGADECMRCVSPAPHMQDAQSWLYASATGVLPRPTGLHLSLITER